mgnify:CR=1 FL=1
MENKLVFNDKCLFLNKPFTKTEYSIMNSQKPTFSYKLHNIFSVGNTVNDIQCYTVIKESTILQSYDNVTCWTFNINVKTCEITSLTTELNLHNDDVLEIMHLFQNHLIARIPYLKMYIAVLDEVNTFMVPTLVAHSTLGAHLVFHNKHDTYNEWLEKSFRKVVVKVDRNEFEKIRQLTDKGFYVYEGHENTTLGGEKSCLVTVVSTDNNPRVLKRSKLWNV